MQKFADFPWPAVGEANKVPVWSSGHFQIESKQFKILTFGRTISAWSPELTDLHEREAHSSHPIDVASRALAVESMKLLKGRPRSVILDVGCSSGFLVDYLSRTLPESEVIGADYLPELVMKGAERHPDNPFLQFDLRECPLRNACLDGVTALNVLEHIDDDEKALAEIYRILKNGGLAHIEVPADPTSFDLYDEVLMHFRRYRLEDMVTKAEKAGFLVRRATHLGFFLCPLFKAAKKRNQHLGRTLSIEQKKNVVARQIGATKNSKGLAIIFAIERWLGSFIDYPAGIRVVLRLEKP